MDFQQKMMEYAKYGISVRTSSSDGIEYYMVSLTFGTKWKVEPVSHPEQTVMCAKVSNDGTYCYMTEVKNGLNPVFELVDETIRYNEELEKKVELLKVKAEELKELFASKSYDELVRLKFVIETPCEPSQPKTKRQPKSGKKTPQKPNMESTEGISVEANNISFSSSADTDKYVESDDGNIQIPMTGCIIEGDRNCEPSEIDKKIAEAMGE